MEEKTVKTSSNPPVPPTGGSPVSGEEGVAVAVAKISGSEEMPLIYLPKSIREAIGLCKGMWVIIKVINGKIVIEKLHKGGETEG